MLRQAAAGRRHGLVPVPGRYHWQMRPVSLPAPCRACDPLRFSSAQIGLPSTHFTADGVTLQVCLVLRETSAGATMLGSLLPSIVAPSDRSPYCPVMLIVEVMFQ